HQEDTLVSIDSIPKGHNGYLSALNAQRVLFIPSPVAHLTFSKMNNQEANIILSVLRDLHTLYGSQSVSLSKKTIGIITPFRSQIINIRHHLQQLDFELDCVIDTVERFQGGACDIIIISMVVSNPDQMQMICSGGEGIDRKMNVALTRARERLIMVGNPEILSLSPFYKSFIDEYGIAPDISIE
ncbi:MAG TPA: C-terminal helicase domain-containing protein, partial [Saprospiraceae bacterium]|nr:C-terminal helicase domain-containing protein [Saprospiraceae bacterium]